jgi:DNA polymerase-4
VIAHFDIDAFYASVAQRDDPSLRGLPLAVAGNSRRAVVLTASYEARPFGVRSAMPLYKARALCPQLRVVAPNFERYRDASQRVFAIFARGAGAVEGLSLDEAFVGLDDLDLTAAVSYAEGVRRAVRDEVGLTVSAGIAARKMVAKIASDEAKPDGLRAVSPGDEAEYLAPMPVGRLWGVGPKTLARLTPHGIVTIGDIANLSDAPSNSSAAAAKRCANSRAATIRAASNPAARRARSPPKRRSNTICATVRNSVRSCMRCAKTSRAAWKRTACAARRSA